MWKWLFVAELYPPGVSNKTLPCSGAVPKAMNPDLHKALVQLRTGERLEMWEAAKALVKEEDPSVVPELLALLADSMEPERRAAAAWTLGFLRASDAVQPLTHILVNKAEPPALREHAAEALGYLSDASARSALISSLSDENPDVVFSSTFALRTVGETEDIPHLARLAAGSGLVSSNGESVMREAQEAIDQIKTRAERKLRD